MWSRAAGTRAHASDVSVTARARATREKKCWAYFILTSLFDDVTIHQAARHVRLGVLMGFYLFIKHLIGSFHFFIARWMLLLLLVLLLLLFHMTHDSSSRVLV